MNKGIKGRYFDGQSSIAHPVDVHFRNGEKLLLQSKSKSILWDINSLQVEKIGHRVSINIPESGESLSIEESDNALVFLRDLESIKPSSIYQKLINASMGTKGLITFGLIVCIGLFYHFVIPNMAEKMVTVIPKSFDKNMGDAFTDTYIEFTEEDSIRSELLQAFVNELDFSEEIEINVSVVNSGIVNAFALPNGRIVVYSGLLDRINDKDQLAALIGHEVAHVQNRHSVKMMSRNLAGYIFLSLVLSDINGVMGIITDNLHELQSLSYSRSFEKEADMAGIEMLHRNQLDPHGMIRLFETLNTVENISGKIPEFLSSHPVTSERINYSSKTSIQSNNTQSNNVKLDSIFQSLSSD